MREGEAEHTYSQPWALMTAAVWARYPNPFATHVLTEDVLERWIDQDGCLHSKRLLSKTNRKPKWMEIWLPDTTVWIIEESTVDPAKQEMRTLTHNVSLNYFMLIEEDATFRAQDASTTTFESKVHVSSQLPIARMVESFGLSRYQRNALKAVKGVNWALANRELYQAHSSPLIAARLHTSVSGAVALPLPLRQWLASVPIGQDLLQWVDAVWCQLQHQWEDITRTL
eukprot:m.24254 g.24254  ORF g.24254 m.24254 type:complete len:227 (-) comp11484_c0_seq2:77-757(-)